ncbi:hypothetical protein [Nitrobacter sp. TKz-YC01]|uniref:hypothetical protein n=1 Tax=Nitrobacter sp. TKz-YC01 TaxID=3398703 RepID=UPI003A1026B9
MDAYGKTASGSSDFVKFPVISLIAGNCVAETRSHLTASATNKINDLADFR